MATLIDINAISDPNKVTVGTRLYLKSPEQPLASSGPSNSTTPNTTVVKEVVKAEPKPNANPQPQPTTTVAKGSHTGATSDSGVPDGLPLSRRLPGSPCPGGVAGLVVGGAAALLPHAGVSGDRFETNEGFSSVRLLSWIQSTHF